MLFVRRVLCTPSREFWLTVVVGFPLSKVVDQLVESAEQVKSRQLFGISTGASLILCIHVDDRLSPGVIRLRRIRIPLVPACFLRQSPSCF
jgi:hypothetical protein